MAEPQTVTVYNFMMLDQGLEVTEPAPFKATRERITALRHARLLEGTAEKVPTAALDDRGFYRRIATGWGEL